MIDSLDMAKVHEYLDGMRERLYRGPLDDEECSTAIRDLVDILTVLMGRMPGRCHAPLSSLNDKVFKTCGEPRFHYGPHKEES